MRFTAMLNYIICIALFVVVNQGRAESFNAIIYSEQWDMPRHGEILIKQPELAKIVNLWSSQAGSRIELRYPGGEEGELWVQELMDWLVALGVPSAAILRSPGSGSEDIISIVLNNERVKGNKIDE